MIKKIFGTAFFVFAVTAATAQEHSTTVEEATTQTTHEEDPNLPVKLHHAEPLYIDLIRDLGARKGEKEWNIGGGMREVDGYYRFTPFIEYEWAVADRLGLEIELPFTFYGGEGKYGTNKPGAALDGLKTAIMYTFLVDKKNYTSMAIGYINELEFNSFRDYNQKFLLGNVYNPFFVVAKGWGKSHLFNTLVYAGPVINHHFATDARIEVDNSNTKITYIPGTHSHVEVDWQVNTNFHYNIPNSRNFIGLEVNKSFTKERFNMVLRPQMRVAIKDNLILGLVVGIPTNREHSSFSGFTRLIWEPHSKKKAH